MGMTCQICQNAIYHPQENRKTIENFIFNCEKTFFASQTSFSCIRDVWFKYELGQKYYTPQVRPDQGLSS